jgi:aminoglycoside phosphotransferase (APT) family kinase protein
MDEGNQLRTRWSELPPEIHSEVARVLGGDIVEAVSQNTGFSPGSADRVRTEAGRRAFVKAVSRHRNPDSIGMHRREVTVMRALPSAVRAPRLLGSFDNGEWVALVLEDLPGRHPGSANDGSDVFAVLAAVESLPLARGGDMPALPEASDELADDFAGLSKLRAEGATHDLPSWVQQNLDALEASANHGSAAVGGDYLVHLDCRADNVLIDDSGNAWIVDWPWAAIGAHWLDGLTYLLDARLRGERLDAEAILREHPLFAGVPRADIDAVLAGLMGLFFERGRLPAPLSMPTLRRFQLDQALAAMAWLQERWGTA